VCLMSNLLLMLCFEPHLVIVMKLRCLRCVYVLAECRMVLDIRYIFQFYIQTEICKNQFVTIFTAVTEQFLPMYQLGHEQVLFLVASVCTKPQTTARKWIVVWICHVMNATSGWKLVAFDLELFSYFSNLPSNSFSV